MAIFSADPSLPSPVQAALNADAMIPAEIVAEWLRGGSLTIEQALLRLLPLAAGRAHAPVSGFRVGAVALGMPSASAGGHAAIYLGANLEFNGPLGWTVHAEQAAVNLAWLRGETGLQMLAVTAPPCGHCRQFLWELSTAAELRVLVAPPGGGQTPVEFRLTELLPSAFGPRDLGHVGGLLSHFVTELGRIGTELGDRAIAAAGQSYVPYTGSLAGVALKLSDGRIFIGRSAESAAFNPSLPPLQSALSALVLQAGPNSFRQIQRSVLAEVQGSITQRAATEVQLRALVPEVHFQNVWLAVPGGVAVGRSGHSR